MLFDIMAACGLDIAGLPTILTLWSFKFVGGRFPRSATPEYCGFYPFPALDTGVFLEDYFSS